MICWGVVIPNSQLCSMSEYKLLPSADLLSCTFEFISSWFLHQIGCVNTCWKAYTRRYQIYNTKATDLHKRVNNSAKNSSVWLTPSLGSLSVREQPITPRTRVGLGGSAPILHMLAAESSGMWGFFDGSYPAPTADFMPERKIEFKNFSKAAFNGLFRSNSESLKMDIKKIYPKLKTRHIKHGQSAIQNFNAIHLTSERGYRIMLVDVLFVPGLAANLLSVAVCMRRGGKMKPYVTRLSSLKMAFHIFTLTNSKVYSRQNLK